jgi:hypothetical protein
MPFGETPLDSSMCSELRSPLSHSTRRVGAKQNAAKQRQKTAPQSN